MRPSTALLAALGASAAAAQHCYLSAKAAPRMSHACAAGATPGDCLNDVALYSTGPALKETTYTYDSAMDGRAMHFDTDCSCWAGYVLDSFYPAAFALLPNDTTVTPAVPRAQNFYDFLAAPSGPWSNVGDIRTVVPGDVIAYRLPPGSTDTGHVMFAVQDDANPITVPYDGRDDAVWVWVADASTVKHQNDTRCADCQFQTGLGRGYVAFSFDATGRPSEFQFCDTCSWHSAKITAGRLGA